MELSKKTTILFSPELHRRLTEYAARRGVSLGELVREACEVTYGIVDQNAREQAAAGMARLELPVSSPAEMKLESVASAQAPT